MNNYMGSASSPQQSTRGIDADGEVSDLISCDAEPIRIPGSIQPHGFLLGLEIGQETIVFASKNAEIFLGSPIKLLLGSHWNSS